ncbi:39916_t:CDS:2, partial [Gigaspora margarita]
QNEVNEVASQEASRNLFLPVTSINCNEISKRYLLETLSIPDAAFEQVANLHLGLQFEYWDHINLVLLAYGQKKDAIPDISQHMLRQLLQGEFKDQLFLNKDLANIIQHFKKDNTTDPDKDPENDVSNLLKVLRTFKEEDPIWFISDHCVKNRLYHLFWMTPY